MGDDQNPRYAALIDRYLWFYEELRTKARRPKSAEQRQFQDVAWGKAEPQTEHEHAYVDHLNRIGRPPRAPFLAPQIQEHDGYPEGSRPIPADVGQKWDAAAENMARWKPWHD